MQYAAPDCSNKAVAATRSQPFSPAQIEAIASEFMLLDRIAEELHCCRR
jgi:hypothetical protein